MPRNALGGGNYCIFKFQICLPPTSWIYKSHFLAKNFPPKAKWIINVPQANQIQNFHSFLKVWGGMTLWSMQSVYEAPILSHCTHCRTQTVHEFTSKCTYRNFAGLKELKTCTSEVYQPSASWAKQTCVLISLKSYNALPVHIIAALMICDTMKLCILHLAVYFSFNTYVYVYIYVKVNVDNPVILNNRSFYRMTSSFG